MPKKGRKGVEQRVKGNVKAASSGRMADLLGGEMTAGVIGFEAVSRGLVEGRDGEEVEEVSHGAGARFQVVMKQLGKKDTTTKIKALTEFSSLCDEEPAEAVVAILNIWTLMYNKLSTDNDNRVREVSHRAMQSCVGKVKNSMGPLLRSILGPWLAGMCDPYGSAASAAQTAFSTAFSPEKQTNVLTFGFKVIISFVEDVVLKQTQDTFSDPKVVAADERLQRYERVVSMCLHGLSLALCRLPAEFLAEKRGDWEGLLTEKRLWKLTRHNNPYIRASVYKLVVTLCQCCGDFVSSNARQFCSLVLSSLGEKEPGVVGPLWEAVLLTTSLCQDWREHVNVPKAVLPGLWQLLSEGGYGSARQVYPCLLPLLTRMVQQVYPSDVNFATSFVEKLKTGVGAERVRGLVSESEAVLQTCSQCLCHILVAVDTQSLSHDERNWFYEKLLGMVVELVEYSVTQCPRTQASVLCSWIGRILDDLLEIGSSHPWMEQYLQGWLQPQLTETLSSLLRQGSDKAHFSKIGVLLKSLGSHYSKPDADRRVTFDRGTAPQVAEHAVDEDAEGISSEVEKNELKKQERERKMSDEVLSARMTFLRPAIAGVCAQCVSSVVKRQSVEHCSMLCEILDLYGGTETATLVYRDNQIASLLEENGETAGNSKEDGGEVEEEVKIEGGGEEGKREAGSITEIVVCLSSCLLRAIDDSVISGRDPRLMEGVAGSVLHLLQIQGVAVEDVSATLHQMVQDHPSILLLLLTKLGEGKGKGKKKWVRVLLQRHQSLLLQLVSGGGREEGVRGEHTFLWPFLELSLTSTGSYEGEEEMKRSVLETISEVLQITLQPQLQSESDRPADPAPAIIKLLQTLARASADVIEDFFTYSGSNGSALLNSMLLWCLDNCKPEHSSSSILAAVCQCYSHLVTLLPEPASYLESTAALLSSLLHNDLDRVFAMAVAVHLLHSPALDSYGTFWSLYQPLRPQFPAQKTGYLPLSALETYCANQPYAPLFTDLSTENIVTTLTGSALSVLFLATALCSGPKLTTTLSSLEFDASLCGLISNSDGAPTNLGIAFPVSNSHQEKKSYYRLWRSTVRELMLALCALQPSQAISQSHTEEEVVSVLSSALQQCLVLGSRDHHEWNTQMLDELIDRASMDGPLWCEVLKQFISALESSVGEEDRLTVLPDFISVVLRDMEPALVLAAISGLSNEGKKEVEGRLMGGIRGRESDLCLLCACLHLLPKFRSDLLSLVRTGLSSVASKHGSSEITLFESLDESVQDPMVYSLLDLISLLCVDRSVPSDTWDFILCALVTITHLVSEATPTQRDSVNYTVFYCKAMDSCYDVASFLTSPLSPNTQASEWREFFAPDIHSCLLPAFLKSATQTSPESLPSHCDILQSYHLSRTVAEVCPSAVEGISLESLIDIFFSPLHPFRVTAFLLAKRLVSIMQFIVEGSTNTEKEEDTTNTIIVPEVRGLLSAAMGRVNLDLTLRGETTEDGGEDDTIAYLLLCLFLIEVMSHSGPEARASLGEWVKERSLVPHLLRGLFTVLSDTTSSTTLKTRIEVTLEPDLQTLCTVVYSAVARHLPSMLRQWYLSVDRFTSSTVTAFTTKYVSPALQQTELEAVGKTTTTHGNMEVRAYTSVSEVSVVYRLHEFSIELFVRLPTNYPLQPPSIREGKRVRVDASQWRKWMLQLNVFIANQNGTLMDGLLLWKSNLDKHFSGIEDCMICFSVIHGSLYSLPKMTCRTCKKKFHSACLYKWFSTSNKSSCPLCRNIF